MDGRRGHVRAGRHRSHGKLLVEIEMGSVRLVRENEHARRVRDLHDLDEVRADAVIGRVIDENRLRIRIRRDGLLHVGDGHAERNAQPLVTPRIDVDRHGAVHHERVDGAAMDVSRQDDLVAAIRRSPDHGLHGRGRAVHHEERVIGPEKLGGETLGVFDDGNRVAEVIERLHGIDVQFHAQLAEILGELGVHAPALVGRDVKVRQAVDPLRV